MNTPTSSRIAVLTLIILCAALAAATGFSFKHARELDANLQQATRQPERSPVNVNPDDEHRAPTSTTPAQPGDITALLDENTRLREQVDALSGARAASGTNAVLGANARQNRQSFMARLQQQDPERYKQIVAQRDERRKQVEQRYQDQLAALDQRAQTAQSQEEVDLTTQIADTLAKIQQLRQSRSAVRDLPEDQRDAAVEQLRNDSRDAWTQLNTLRDQDRTMQLQQLAGQVGIKDSTGAQQFSDSVQQIYKNTEYNAGPGAGPGRGPGRDGGGGPPPQTPAPQPQQQ